MSRGVEFFFVFSVLFAGVLSGLLGIYKAKASESTSLTIAVPSAPQGKECIIEATLKDENDNPLQNIDIDFYVCNTDRLGTTKTDSNGVASLNYTFPRAGTYKVSAVFSGTKNYAQSNSEDVFIVIAEDYTPYIVGGGIGALAIAGVAGYIVFRRRRKLYAHQRQREKPETQTLQSPNSNTSTKRTGKG